ncbi:MAG: HAMP domain-containing histidine kinase [Lachnospiraceae bacterium]|nr:HAMP domain-containing histidine kinase [Lachnospiraceae bacterium]
MNERRIHHLRIKFLLISFLSLTLAMIAVTGMILASNQLITRRNIRHVLNYIIENEGDLPGAREHVQTTDRGAAHNYSVVRFLNEIFNPRILEGDYRNPEFFYNNRYFAIIYDEDFEIRNVITNHTSVVSEEEAAVYGQAALDNRLRFGRYSDYYYQVADLDDGGTIVVYLDSSNIISSNVRLLYVTIGMILLGMVIVVFFTVYFSKWAITSEIKNMEAQKGFITNASHELKTPLAVIRANTEMIEMTCGQNEWTQSTTRQVDRMTGLIQNLVMIARAEEHEAEKVCEACDITGAVSDTIRNFVPVAANEGKKLTGDLAPGISMKIADSHIRQLASLLIDNAIKYCDDGGSISVALSQKGRTALLCVSDDYRDGEGKDFSKFFERFYREDESHNSDKGGYGIGLSIAEGIVKMYKGSIRASWSDGRIFFACTLKG